MDWVFSGRITPERASLDCADSFNFSARTENGFEMDYSLSIHANQVTVAVVEKVGEIELSTLKNIIATAARVVVDLIGFSPGNAYDVEITSAINVKTGAVSVFGIDIPAIAERRRASPFHVTHKMLSASCVDAGAIIALADFREARKDPLSTRFHCYRAAEAIMHSFREEGETKGVAWERLRTTLRVTEALTRGLQAGANAARHGEAHSITDEERRRVLLAADTILLRYLLFIEGERRPLPDAMELADWPE